MQNGKWEQAISDLRDVVEKYPENKVAKKALDEAMFHASPEIGIKAGYYIVDPDSDEISGMTDLGASLLAVGVDYNFTKAVQLYLQYAGVMNQDNGEFHMGDYNGFGAPTDVSAPGETVSGFSFGSVVKF